MILTQMFALGAVGFVSSRTGHYKYLIVAGPAVGALGRYVIPTRLTSDFRSGMIYYANFSTQLSVVLGVTVLSGVGIACFLRT
jgi:hypothetical protein